MDAEEKGWTETAEQIITALARCHKHMNEIYGEGEDKIAVNELPCGLIVRLEDSLAQARLSAERLAAKTGALVSRF